MDKIILAIEMMSKNSKGEDTSNISVLRKMVADRPDIPIITEWQPYLTPETPEYIFNIDKEIAVLICGSDICDTLTELDRTRVVHFGLRKYSELDIQRMEVLTVNKTRVFAIENNPALSVEKINRFLDFDPAKEPVYELRNKTFATCDDGIEVLSAFDATGPLGFDFESFKFPENEDFVPVGISVANKNDAIYIDFRYAKDEETRKKFFEYFEKWVDEHYKQLICYYAAFEVCALKLMFKKLYPLNDAMALVRCDDRRGSLKLNAQSYLHIGAWDTKQDDLMDALECLFPYVKTWEEVAILKGDIYKDTPEVSQKYENPMKIKDSLDVLARYDFDPKMYDRFWGGPFAVTPTEVTGLYCMYDAFYTLHLFNEINRRHHYVGKINEEVCNTL